MKFAKELEHELVPEWRAKYLDYKQGKKKVKAVQRAIARAQRTPRIRDTVRRTPALQPSRLSAQYEPNGHVEPTEPLGRSSAPMGGDAQEESSEGSSSDHKTKATTPMLMNKRRGSNNEPRDGPEYGSFVLTPPSKPQHLELPGPALPTDSDERRNASRIVTSSRTKSTPDATGVSRRASTQSTSNSAYEVGRKQPQHRSTFNTVPSRSSQQGPGTPASTLRRFLSSSRTPGQTAEDVNLPIFNQVKERKEEFRKWIDEELEKIETFYKSKEDEATTRLEVIRDQLHEMRRRRMDEVEHARRAWNIRKEDERILRGANGDGTGPANVNARDQFNAWMEPVEKALEAARARALGPRPGPNTRALQDMHHSPCMKPYVDEQQTQRVGDPAHDYTRRKTHEHEVPYRAAKRKLKIALKEYYHGLELLKSYALLNRTAFRKINKKYDKAVNAHPPLRFMAEKVNKAWFVQSTVLEEHIHTVEDLYARYFERGNHKIAVGKLRSSLRNAGEHAGSALRSGLWIGAGAVFAIQGLTYAAEILYDPMASPTTQTNTTYLLQIYAGYFLALYLFAWFCLDCIIWTRNKINYVFIFEFDPRNHLDWRELAEFPAFLLLLMGIVMWLNFTQFGSPAMFTFYPVILIFISVVIIFFPAPILYHKARRWFVYSHWRLLLAGLYPVEFRDFLLGDMYCSLTFLMSNIELFFCLYARHWNGPEQCNSSHSRLLGFFSTLPGIWRALQCIRRYWDTRNVFPHLVNCGKYGMTIMYYFTLSLYRMQNTSGMLALFITFAAINAVYTSIWDLAMDWSLCQPSKKLLRDVRGYKPVWPYYLAMTLDPILRFNWIFYIIYTHDLQHSSIAAFLIAFSEVSRRGMWAIFRVENEHCANVQRFRASRDAPLPYPINEQQANEEIQREQSHGDEQEETFEHADEEGDPTYKGDPSMTKTPTKKQEQAPGSPLAQRSSRTPKLSARNTFAGSSARSERDGGDAEAGGAGLRRRGIGRKMTLQEIFANAHTQDFEKKRKPGAGDSGGLQGGSLSRVETRESGVGGYDEDGNGYRSSDDEDGDAIGTEEGDDDIEASSVASRDNVGKARLRGKGREDDRGRASGER